MLRIPSLARILLVPFLMSGLHPTRAEQAADGPRRDLWEQTLETATGWWRESRDFADQAMEDARRLFADEQDFGRVWESVVPKLEDALELEERQAQLPERSWLGADRLSNRAAIDELLDEAVEVLSIAPAQRYRDDIQMLQGRIASARAEIAEFRRKRVSAPAASTLEKTVADYDRLIGQRETEIERLKEQMADSREAFAEELRAMGLALSEEQVGFLLSTVVGDHMVDLGILFDNVKAITLQLEELVVQSGEDLQSARRYYGLYVVLLKALDRMHLQIEEAIGEQYLPQIDSILARAESLAGETRYLLHESPDKAALLNANLEAQQLTIEAATVYRQYLDDQSREMERARRKLGNDIAAAWNTYETVRVSGELVGLVKSSQQLLEGLMTRQVPALRPFENLEMQRELERLTQQLRSPATSNPPLQGR